MDITSIASSLVQTQAAQTAQKLSTVAQKANIEAQQSVADLLTTETAAVGNPASANSAITGRGQVLDISV